MRFNREPEEEYRMDMTPMIDVVFLLLIFFMVSTSFVDFAKKMDINLPESSASQQTLQQQEVTIEMGRGGSFVVNGKNETEENILPILKEHIAQSRKLSVIIRADKAIEYGRVIKVLGYCKELKIEDVSVAVK